MGPETIVLAASAITKVALQALLKNLSGELGKNAGTALSASAKATLKRWQADQVLQDAHARSKRIRHVKTIWQVEREVDLAKFYYPSKIKNSSGPPTVVHAIDDFAADGNVVVRGIVGQGKSIFLRFLAAREFELGTRIPVFVELRRLSVDGTFISAAIEEMKNLGLGGATTEIFEHLVEASKIVFLLDGFDEVPDEKASALVQELESLSARMPKLRMIVTSRPENAIERSPHFRVFDLAPLGPGEYAKVVARITNDQTLSEEIVNGVNKSHQSIVSLLSTPLMVSLLIVRYRVGQGIPENRVAFYEPLFMLLLQRHDASKAGYKRKRNSKLSDSQLLNFFNCLCFVTRRDGVSVLREATLNAAATRALKWVNLEEHPPDGAVDDVRRITCLILRDGLDEYRFLHKSVQEFHAACFVRDQPDALSSDFYGAMQKSWSDWQQELQFLETIHKDRYDRYFVIPLLDQVVSTLPGASSRELGEALIFRLSVRIVFQPAPEFQSIVYPRDPVGWCLMKYFEGSKLFDGIVETSVRLAAARPPDPTSMVTYRDLALRDVLAAIAPRHQAALASEAQHLGERIVAALDERKQRMHTLDERKGIIRYLMVCEGKSCTATRSNRATSSPLNQRFSKSSQAPRSNRRSCNSAFAKEPG